MAIFRITGNDGIYNCFDVRAGDREFLGDAVANVLPDGGMYDPADLERSENDDDESAAWMLLRSNPLQRKALEKLLNGEFAIAVDAQGAVSITLTRRS